MKTGETSGSRTCRVFLPVFVLLMTTAKTFSAKSVAGLAGTLAVFVGGMVLVGWTLDIAALKSILPGWVSVKPNTALAFVLTGIALLLSSLPPSTSRSQPSTFRVPRSFVARLCGWLAGLIGLLSLCEYVFGWNPGFDLWLFREAAGTVGTSNPGRMAPDTALCFLMLAVGLEATRTLRQRNRMLTGAVILGGLVMTLGVAAISTYFTPAFGNLGWWGLTNMAMPTAALFVVLGVALILVVWQTGDLNWSLGRKTTLAYAGGLTLVVFLGLHTSRSALWQDETAHRVAHAEQEFGAISDVLAEAAKTQVHTRGYVITGEDRYLQSQQVAASRCRVKLAVLRQLIVDPVQQVRGAGLEVQVNELLQWYPQVIEARRTGVTATVQRDMVNHGEDLMDSVRALIVAMEAAEQRLLDERHRQAHDVARFTQVFITIGTLVSLMVFLSALTLLNHTAAQRLQAANILQKSEERFRMLFEQATDGMLLVDAATRRFLLANRQMQKMLGYSEAELIQLTVADLHTANDLPAMLEQFAKMARGDSSVSPDLPMRRKDGTVFHVNISSSPVRLQQRECLMGIFRDVTERKQAEEALFASETRYRRLFESAKDGILILDAETGMILDVNPYLVELLGFSHDAFLGKKIWELGFFKDIVANQDNFAELQQKEYIRYEDMALETANGRRIEVEFISSVYLVNRQKVIQCTIRDITERKQAESEIGRLHEDLHRHALELEQRIIERTAQLEEANKELEAFSYSVSHDLRAPLRAIDGYGRILVEDCGDRLDPEGRRVLGVISIETQRMGRLIDDLLAFSRLGRRPLKQEALAPLELVRRALAELHAEQVDRHIEWTIGDLPASQGDPALLLQVWVNLLANAIKFTKNRDPAVIEIGSRPEDGQVVYYVKDNGVGFDMKYAPKLFGVFQRLHSADEFDGTGVGLALVQRIVHRHGGRVWAEGKVNAGATFSFSLPNLKGAT